MNESEELHQSPSKCSDVSPILASKMEEACERRLYSTTSSFKLNDTSLPLVSTAVDPRYRLSVFPSELKEMIEKLLKIEVINYSQREDR